MFKVGHSVFIIFILVILNSFTPAQKEKFFGDDSKIISFEEINDLYTLVVRHNHDKAIYVYNESGDELFFKKIERPNLTQAFYISETNLIMIFAGDHVLEASVDQIVSLNPSENSINWEVEDDAGEYSVSPKGNYILKKTPPINSEGSFRVRNTVDGNSMNLQLESTFYIAEWITDKQFVIIEPTFNKESSKDPQLENLILKEESLWNDKKELSSQHRSKLLSDEEYEAKSSLVIEEIRSTIEQIRRYRRALRNTNSSSDGGTIKIYDIDQNSVVHQVLTQSSNGKPLSILPKNPDLDLIRIHKGVISILLNTEKKGIHYLNSYTTDLSLIKSVEMNNINHITIVSYFILGDELYLKYGNNKLNAFMISSNTSTKLNLNKKDIGDLGFEDENSFYKMSWFISDNKILVGEYSDRITFKGGRNEY
ncbi:MAG: hypothetical protein SCALA702_02010 [Melioribacteraceae bacterium]|nr:MAG: hypothetical protein SCALA702_02010 [Melioribacteraceae bacterium]